jgi:hypothetical protein
MMVFQSMANNIYNNGTKNYNGLENFLSPSDAAAIIML